MALRPVLVSRKREKRGADGDGRWRRGRTSKKEARRLEGQDRPPCGARAGRLGGRAPPHQADARRRGTENPLMRRRGASCKEFFLLGGKTDRAHPQLEEGVVGHG